MTAGNRRRRCALVWRWRGRGSVTDIVAYIALGATRTRLGVGSTRGRRWTTTPASYWRRRPSGQGFRPGRIIVCSRSRGRSRTWTTRRPSRGRTSLRRCDTVRWTRRNWMGCRCRMTRATDPQTAVPAIASWRHARKHPTRRNRRRPRGRDRAIRLRHPTVTVLRQRGAEGLRDRGRGPARLDGWREGRSRRPLQPIWGDVSYLSYEFPPSLSDGQSQVA